MKNSSIYLSQSEHCNKLQSLNHNIINLEKFEFKRARGSYIAAVCRSNATFVYNAASQVRFSTAEDAKRLNTSILTLKENGQYGPRFVKLVICSLKLRVFVESGFASIPDLSSLT